MFKKLFIATACILSTICYGDLQDDIDRATIIIREFKEMPETSIPRSVLQNAKGLGVITMIKGGFIFSGRIGSGLVVAKLEKGWSAPSAIGVAGAGFGLQVGAEVTDFVIVLNTQNAVDAFSRGGNVTLGANLSVAAGPVGRTAEGAVMPLAAIYSYSRSQGLFAGVSLEGTIIGERSGANKRFYKKSVSAADLLSGKIPSPESAKPLYKVLSE